MGRDRPRRVVGYFPSWRTGSGGEPAYLVSDVPWSRITHIQYAFAHIDGRNRISIGDPDDPTNPATGITWPGVSGAEMAQDLDYRGHFNLLTRYKRRHPEVKTIISVGGWSETGGHFSPDGSRVNTGGFYSMTTLPDGGVNRAGIDAFVRSVVEFLRRYGFDGVDIDYEFPTSMPDVGHPLDQEHAKPRRPYLAGSYVELMKRLREELDRAGQEDGRYYLLAAAVPASAYVLRGMEAFQAAPYMDYVNIMAYDFHGSWNDHVGHHAALFDSGEDSELEEAGIYESPLYRGIGYLNADWAYHYYRGALAPGRLNLGIPYYTRGWRGVVGGERGLWGRAPLPDQSRCPPGTGVGERNRCGQGAQGIDDLWSDAGEQVGDAAGGLNPLWHAKNLEEGIEPSYLTAFGLDPASDPRDRLEGRYVRRYDEAADATWLWNDEKAVFLSTEDRESVTAKAEFVEEHGLGGVMLWDLAGDFGWHPERRAGEGEYFVGSTLTTLLHELLQGAGPYQTQPGTGDPPREALALKVELTGFGVGDENYHLSPVMRIANDTGVDLPGGLEIRFDIPTSTPDNVSDRSGLLRVVRSGHTLGHNVGGLRHDLHRVGFTLPACPGLPAGESFELEMVYYLPMSGPSNYTVTVGDRTYALASEHPELPSASLPPDVDREGVVCGG